VKKLSVVFINVTFGSHIELSLWNWSGSFDTMAMLLNQTIGAVNFAPLKTLAVTLARTTRLMFYSSPGSEPLVTYLTRTPDATSK
jgi:hypothetical protein